MAASPPGDPGHWFLRGVQSAIFYYVSCTPCLDLRYVNKRRKEARAARTAAVVTAQPGVVGQPMAFQTNEAWAEDLMMGPGPPKGWKADELLQKLKKKDSRDPPPSPPHTQLPVTRLPSLEPAMTAASTNPRSNKSTSSSCSDEAPHVGSVDPSSRKPSMERRLSNAMENLKDSLRQTLHSDRWNWRRYEREDETLWGFGGKVTQMWNRATSYAAHDGNEEPNEDRGFSLRTRKRADTNETVKYDYNRARFPEVNDLHPPVVSQLPATRDAAQWMLLPPPSAGVMLGYKRPGSEVEMRWPMCVIGRPRGSNDKGKGSRASLSDTEDDQSSQGLPDDEDEDFDGPDDTEFEASTTAPRRLKHLSDPIMFPPPIHSRKAIAGELLTPKRRDSWQFHIHVPSSRSSMA